MDQTGPVELEAKASGCLAKALGWSITSPEAYTEAASFLKALKTLQKDIDETFRPIIAKQFAAHREAVAQAKRHSAPLIEAEGVVKDKMAAWKLDQERKRQAEEIRRRAEALKETEHDRLEEALALEAAGQTDAAKMMLELPIVAPPVVVRSSVPEVKGISTSTLWKFRIVNAALIPREYLIPDEKKIGAIVRAAQGAMTIPGVEMYSEECVRASAGS